MEDGFGGLGAETLLLDVVDEDLEVLFLDVNEDEEVLSSGDVEVLSSEDVEDEEVLSSDVVEDVEVLSSKDIKVLSSEVVEDVEVFLSEVVWVLFLRHLLEVHDRLDVAEGLGRHVRRRVVLEHRVFPACGPKKEALLIGGQDTGEAASSENGILDKLCADEGIPGSSPTMMSSPSAQKGMSESSTNMVSSSSLSPHKGMSISWWCFAWSFPR